MIIPMVCFTCGKPIAHLWDTYLSLVTKFQSELPEGTVVVGLRAAPEYKALAELHISRECCRRMFLSQFDLYDKIH